jgi:hypothetical protein
MNGGPSGSSVCPLATDLSRSVSTTIDISGLLRSQAIEQVNRETGSLDSVQELAGKTKHHLADWAGFTLCGFRRDRRE